MNTRAGNIGSFPLSQSKGGSLRRILIFGLVVIGLMVYVGGKVQIMRLGYQIDELEKQKRDLERMNRSLQIEASSLSAPGRIEEIAVKRLGMVRPAKENVVVVKRKQGGAARNDRRPAAP
jgi:cell division protein FtsL